MKKMIIAGLFMMLAGGAFAQSGKMKDCIMMKDGKMMVMKGGMSMMLDKDTTVHSTMVMKDGTLKMKDGTTYMMKEGDCVLTNGKVKMMKMDKMPGDKMK